MESYQERIDEIKAKYQPRLENIQQRAKALADQAGNENLGTTIDLKFKVDWVDHDIIFEFPAIVMKTQEMSLDLPQITMKTQGISFDVPEMYMKDVVISDTPLPRVVISVPDFRMVTKNISMDIPEFTMGRTSFSMDIPEIYTETVHWVLKIPEFTAQDFNARVNELEDKGQELKVEGEQLANEMKAEFSQVFQSGLAEGKQSADSNVIEPFRQAIEAYDRTIKNMEDNKVDPIKVPTENGVRNLRQERDALVSQYKSIAMSLNGETQPAAA